jgi:hypothetical protein
MSSSHQISRLTTVSHVLYDREVLTLRQENERLHQENEVLKLKLFWKHHDIRTLQSNITTLLIHYRRQAAVLLNDQVQWATYMEPIMQSYGLEVGIADEHRRPSSQSNLNVHLVCNRKYFITSYGAKLWNAKSVNDPEIQKLKLLFDNFADTSANEWPARMSI